MSPEREGKKSVALIRARSRTRDGPGCGCGDGYAAMSDDQVTVEATNDLSADELTDRLRERAAAVRRWQRSRVPARDPYADVVLGLRSKERDREYGD